MCEAQPLLQFRVQWKFKTDKNPVTYSYVAPSLKEFLENLAFSEGVSPSVTDYIYVHLLDKDGVKEVYTHEAASGLQVIDFTTSKAARSTTPNERTLSEEQYVLNALTALLTQQGKLDRKKKPRIKLKNKKPSSIPFITGGMGRFTAYEAH